MGRPAKNLIGQKFGKLTVLERAENATDGHAQWKCQCDCGNENFITTAAHLVTGNTKSCGCSTSIGEDIITSILQSNNIIFEKQKTFKDCILNTGGFGRYDFFLPNQNRLIEYDGEIHFYFTNSGWNTELNFKKIKEHDKIKNEWAAAHNIPLVRIPYWERDNITLDMLLGDQYLIKGSA